MTRAIPNREDPAALERAVKQMAQDLIVEGRGMPMYLQAAMIKLLQDPALHRVVNSHDANRITLSLGNVMRQGILLGMLVERYGWPLAGDHAAMGQQKEAGQP